MAFARASFFTAMIFLGAARASAQSTIDPSSALLLNGPTGSKPHATETRLDSGRYTVRPRISEKPVVEKSTPVRRSADPTPPAPVVLVPTEQGTVIVPDTTPLPKSGVDVEVSESEVHAAAAAVEPASSSRLLEISIASAYFYEGAESGYSFRLTNMAGPAYVATGRVWLSPEFAIGGSYLSTLGGQVADQASAVSASRVETAVGLYLKKLFPQSTLTFGIELVDSQFKVASESVSKLKTKSGGVRLSIEGEFQSTPVSSWLVGFSAAPKLQHEESTAATEVRSGTGVSAYAVGASIERRWKFDSSNAIFIRVEHKVERDLFSGSATMADPVGGATPNGVAATVGTTLIQFGYNWGG